MQLFLSYDNAILAPQSVLICVIKQGLVCYLAYRLLVIAPKKNQTFGFRLRLCKFYYETNMSSYDPRHQTGLD